MYTATTCNNEYNTSDNTMLFDSSYETFEIVTATNNTCGKATVLHLAAHATFILFSNKFPLRNFCQMLKSPLNLHLSISIIVSIYTRFLEHHIASIYQHIEQKINATTEANNILTCSFATNTPAKNVELNPFIVVDLLSIASTALINSKYSLENKNSLVFSDIYTTTYFFTVRQTNMHSATPITTLRHETSPKITQNLSKHKHPQHGTHPMPLRDGAKFQFAAHLAGQLARGHKAHAAAARLGGNEGGKAVRGCTPPLLLPG